MPLQIDVPGREFFNAETSEFEVWPNKTLRFEHSLLSVSKWESKWQTPFLTPSKKSKAQTLDYIYMMLLNRNVSKIVTDNLDSVSLESINDYIDSPQTATVINDRSGKSSNQVVTSELIYYWMITLNIPFECEKWHINRLLTLIKICNIKQASNGSKMPAKELAKYNRQLNQARRKQLGSKG